CMGDCEATAFGKASMTIHQAEPDANMPLGDSRLRREAGNVRATSSPRIRYKERTVPRASMPVPRMSSVDPMCAYGATPSVLCHLMFSIVALTVDQQMRPIS